MSDIPEGNLRDASDTTRLLQVSQIEKLDELVEGISEESTLEDDMDVLLRQYAKTVCGLLELEKHASELRNQASTKFKVMSES
jgi:hypothetical protein